MVSLAIEAAREAGSFLKSNLGKVKTIEKKLGQETNLVTEIDKGAEEIIIRCIKARYPHHSILAEESGDNLSRSDYRWVIDPLDGTTNFTHGFPIFSVSIGIEFKGAMVGGVVYDPNSDEMFSAEKGGGAFVNGTKIAVSTAGRLVESLLVTGFPYNVSEKPDHVVEHFEKFLLEAQGIRRLGSAALDLAYVAAGRLDGYWEIYLNPWDKAAGMVLVAEAGGIVTNFYGQAASIYEKNTLASNGRIHRQMLAVLKKSL